MWTDNRVLAREGARVHEQKSENDINEKGKQRYINSDIEKIERERERERVR